MRVRRSKWLVPLFSVALGIVLLAAQWLGGDPGSGLESLAIMTAFGALILFGRRSETIRGLRGDGRDERFRMIDIHATGLPDWPCSPRSSSPLSSSPPRATSAIRMDAWARSRTQLPGGDRRLPDPRLRASDSPSRSENG